MTELCESLEHIAQGLIQLPGHRYLIGGGQQAGVREEIQGIDVVVEGLLEVQPVCADLAFGFPANDLPAHALPMLRRGELRTQSSNKKQGDALAEEMGVRRKIGGKIALDMPAANPQRVKQVAGEGVRRNRTSLTQMTNPEPRKAAKANLQAAGPIDPEWIRIFVAPVVPLAKDFASKPLLSRESIRSGKRGEVLVPIQFPDDLGISDFAEIEIADLEPHFQRRPFAT